jgi:3',5'-cyclic AMP phosphodiesterase CpdA
MLLQAIDEINDLAPDVVIVTGDLTEDGLVDEFQEAKRHLQLLKCKHVIVGSGNHDSRTTGYRLFPRFFGEPSSVTEIKNAVLITLNSSRPDLDGGEVGYRQRLWMKGCLDKYSDRFKVVAFHHHLIPVPDTGMEKNMVSDAGDVLWSLISYGVNIVLCGHRHRPWMWNIGKLNIIYAGAASTNRLRGFYQNSYNIIQIENRKIKAGLKVIGGKEYDLNPAFIKTLKSIS